MLHLIARRILVPSNITTARFVHFQAVAKRSRVQSCDPVALPLGLWLACSQRHVRGLQRSMIRSGLAGGNLAGQYVIQMFRDDPGQLSTRTEAFGLVY